MEAKLQQCLIGSDIFADNAPGVDSRLQFSASPNGKLRDVSDAKKRALQVSGISIFSGGTHADDAGFL